jgi:hypothetical protein
MRPLNAPKKRRAYCRKCHKQTAWVYINGVRTSWLCLLCATWEEVSTPEELPPEERRAQVLLCED